MGPSTRCFPSKFYRYSMVVTTVCQPVICSVISITIVIYLENPIRVVIFHTIWILMATTMVYGRSVCLGTQKSPYQLVFHSNSHQIYHINEIFSMKIQQLFLVFPYFHCFSIENSRNLRKPPANPWENWGNSGFPSPAQRVRPSP